ncbi:DCC1-like thiol-disulfide oxidoreductase family protein [Aliarcobacter butzleri]|uniref:DCC1-like thiol-disulfide oxidoreductase family protein n=1 Tax=Aliarcobacter butzleri TaxID=28197 RepID=UPI00215B18FC|nr:DCC1-like thiol-disulfide oxidoreductase family protein [Aliarcobacter butzleri]MCR8710569.1 DCC1-like thiol-disulfide oxidoreductase family protein [Aliarcobacter butzleri]
MKIITGYYNFIKKLYEKEESGLALALFRIVYSLVVFAEVWQIFYFRHLIFDPIPYIHEAPFLVYPMLVIWLFFITLLVVGLFTRTAAWVNYMMTVLFLGFTFSLGASSEHNYHIDKEFIPVALLLIFMPISRRLSIDSLLEKIKYSNTKYEHIPKSSVSSLNYIILILAAGLIYFDSIFYKFYSPMWLNGLGVWLPASLPWATWLDLSFILNQEYLIKFLGYLTLFFQVTYIFFVWFKKFKLFYLLVGIGLHIGIVLAFPIPWFGLAMVALYIGIIPSDFYSNLYKKIFRNKKKPTLKFYFDENCPLCNRLRIIVQYFDNGRNIEFLSAQQEAHKNELLKNIPIQELLDNVYSVDNKNSVLIGIDTYVKVLNKVWIFKPIGLLLYLPFIKSIGARIYGFIAKHRITYGCTEDSCNIPINKTIYIEGDESKIKILQNLDLKTIKIFFVAFFIAWLSLSQLVMIQSSLLMNHIYNKFNIPTANSIVNLYRDIFYPFTGLSQHAVFMDSHFQNYNHTVAVVYESKNGEVFLPIIDEQGHASLYDSGRQWVNYSFSVSNKDFKSDQYVNGVKKYIYFWAHKNNIDLTNAIFRIKYKYNQVPYEWEKDLLKKALEKPWKDAGIIGWKNGVFFTNIIDIENQKS